MLVSIAVLCVLFGGLLVLSKVVARRTTAAGAVPA